MRLAQLAGTGRAPTLPMQLELADAAGTATLVVERLLRVLPGQRYVGVGLWRGRKVLAKLLVGSRAARQFERELRGARLLAGQGLATPALLVDGLDAGGGWLLFDYLEPAESLGEAWQAVAKRPLLDDGQQTVLGEALTALATLHGKGLWQADLHLDNLLRCKGELYLIDGGGVQAEVPGQPLSRGRVLENLGVFFAQLPVELEPFLEELLVYYLLANGEHALPLEALLKEIAKVRRWRLRDYLKKVARDCSLFSARKGPSALQVVSRADETLLQPLLHNLDLLTEGGQVVKDGGTATVSLIELDARPLVVKRYNIKGVVHWFKRFWRPSRAWHSWREGHRLAVLGIATPRPLAVVERRWCWLRSKSYLVTERCFGPDLIARFAPYVDSAPPEADLRALETLLAALLRERISHGDLKGHNLLWDDGRWMLIDLDAMQAHRSEWSFRRAYARDRARLLRNWPEGSSLYRLLDSRLPLAKVGD
ncbi:lipopolysaccharide kinase InaA family protein [Pseudomonas sp. LRF_L74]|uniref:lipopolysaccharide kinase InaA family protein n=1 Tax=Pseudomonas sp. LRF_L74 TaxID=3369422 RepID=UPI003F648C0F